MPSGLVLSIIVTVLAFVAAWIGFTPRSGAVQ
jgi:heme/copper-type cytochrome/quinol oxidase subunit 4